MCCCRLHISFFIRLHCECIHLYLISGLKLIFSNSFCSIWSYFLICVIGRPRRYELIHVFLNWHLYFSGVFICVIQDVGENLSR